MKVRGKTCRYCDRQFPPDRRAVESQQCCGREECRRERQRRKWHDWNKRNPNYRKSQDVRNKTHAWAKRYPDYWQHYRSNHAKYRERERRRMAAKRRRACRVAKQTRKRGIAVEMLRKLESSGPKTVAKQTGIARRMDGMVRFLLWKEGVAKQTSMVSGTGPER